MAKTPCPHCGAAVPVPEQDQGPCPECGRRLRFIDVPEKACTACEAVIPLPPGHETVVCAACGTLQAAEEGRALRFMATCPRCGRTTDVPETGSRHDCPHCGTSMRLADAP